MEKISYAEKENFDEILELWDMCFSDFPGFTKWYFKNIYSERNTLIYIKNGIICSMLQETRFEFNNAGLATYIYGACTHPLYRKRGYMAHLIEQSFRNDLNAGIGQSILIPENESLFEFYGKFGYTPTSPQRKEIFMKKFFSGKKESEKYVLKKADISDVENINTLYIKFSKSADFIIRSDKYWNTQIGMFNELGGECLCMYDKENSFLAAYAFIWKENVLRVQEICFVSDEAKSELCAKILNRESNVDCLEILYYDNSAKNSACIKFYNKVQKQNDYIINLMFN